MTKSKENTKKNIIPSKVKNTKAIKMDVKETKENKSISISKTAKNAKIDALLAKIPDFDKIKKEYDLTEENLTPMAVLHKMSETLELYLKIIQQILQPEEFHSMYECGVFNEDDNRKLLILYKKIMFIHREILKSEIINEENNLVALIPTIHKEILVFKPVIAEIVVKMQKAWESNSNDLLKDPSMHYFG